MINDIALGPQNREVKQYLSRSTRDSVLGDLGKVLAPQIKGRGTLQSTFDKHCIKDSSSHRKYWTEESFFNHVRGSYSTNVISGATIALLWKSFYFYAYHPFPLDLHRDAQIDFDAFIRATLLIVSQCDELLGTRELDWYWRQDTAFFRKASFVRMFRSIAAPDHKSRSQQQVDMTSSLSDAMDVLVMIGPQFMHAMPSEPQLESVARKLFVEGPPVAGGQVVRREDLSALIRLLLRLRLKERIWGTRCHFGNLVEAESGEEYLTEVLVDTLTGDNSGQIVTFQQLTGAIDLIPNLLLRFQQLWAVLFQPSDAIDKTKPQVNEMELNSIGGIVSLFVPPIDDDSAGILRFNQRDTRLTLEATTQVSPDSLDTSMSRLSRGISDDSSAYVVIFTDDASTSNTVIGAFFPIPSKTTHMIFQIQPRFRILRWEKTELSRLNLIKPDAKASLSEFAASEGSLSSNNAPYWIGNPLEQGAGLWVDPNKGTATLINTVGGCYTEMPSVGGTSNTGENWDVTIQQARMHIFTVRGSGDRKG
ncbi:hypothetical protein FHL15_009481 [Xylaria flabelliformis]|uniref:TLDc domain-containing protein n=1 Tax=Xylaria flabelliformis TaxID=2512241 RepID=A0A553HNP3_9PEZI|nr:hypothetical protein FHL15_009481 [Xylaria flabelliformis]